MLLINIISVKKFNTLFARLLNTYLIVAREKFQILKNGSDYQGAWPPLHYTVNTIYKYLTMVGTSIPSELLFCKAAQIVNQQRNRLKGKRLNKLLFLQSLSKEHWKLDVFKIADDFHFICTFCNNNIITN